MFQECLNKPVIVINELTLQNQSESETYKNILGGEPTYINLKNRNAEILYRKPVFLTSNLPIWRFVSNDREPILNHMFSHMHLTTSRIIKQYTTKGVPSTEFWKIAFTNLREIQEMKNIPTNEKFMDHLQEFSIHLSPDAQTIISQEILEKDWPPSPIPSQKEHNNSDTVLKKQQHNNNNNNNQDNNNQNHQIKKNQHRQDTH